jgi:DNA-binding XRE family transcriptional regulator
MGTTRTVKVAPGPKASPSRPAGVRLARARPRAFAEWQALRRWGKLPVWEQVVPGYLLRDAREHAGLTQKVLAQRLGVSQQAIAQAERWEANPTVGFLRRWASACGANLRVELARGKGRR